MKQIPYVVLASAVALASGASDAMDVQLNGFASVIAGQVIDDKEILPASRGGGTVLGYDDTVDFKANSRYGLQIFTDLKEGLSATAQLVAAGDSDFDPQMRWAFVSYSFTPDFVIKAGRSRVPFFLFSDSIDVGYSQPWLFPPVDVYILKGIDNIDGINFQYSSDIGEWASKLNLVAGDSRTSLSVAGVDADIRADGVVDLTWSMNHDWFTCQLTHATTTATVDAYDDLMLFFDAAQISLNAEELDLLTLDRDQATFNGVGISFDYTHWLGIAEYTLISVEDAPMQSRRETWYTMLGYRWNALVYHATYISSESPINNQSADIINTKVLPIFADPAGNGQPSQFESLLDLAYLTKEETTSWILGVRYNFHPAASFKVDYHRRNNRTFDVHPAVLQVGVDLVF